MSSTSGRIYCYWTESGRTLKRAKAPNPAPDGLRWAFEISRRDESTGKRRQIGAGGFTTEKLARAALIAKQAERLDQGDAVAFRQPSKMPLADFLHDEWLASVAHERKATTVANYEVLIDAYVKPHIGAVRVSDLTSGRLAGLYRVLDERGSRTGEALSPRTVHHVHRMLTTALGWAVRNGHLRDNPAIGVDRRTPKSRTSAKRDQAWSGPQVAKFLEHVVDDRLRGLWVLALGTGARRGELVALRWSDFGEETRQLHIWRNRVIAGGEVSEYSTKTDESDRVIKLDAGVAAELVSHRARQAEERLAQGLGRPAPDGHIFTTIEGDPLKPDAVTRALRMAVKGAGVPWIKLHGLRHTWASIALDNGVPMHVVKERLGHTSITTTVDLYGHVLQGRDDDAAATVSRAMGLGG